MILCGFCVFLTILTLAGQKRARLSQLEELLLYRDGIVITIPHSEAERICDMIHIRQDAVQELAIDPDAVMEIKGCLALEFAYSQLQYWNDCPYTRILISLAG